MYFTAIFSEDCEKVMDPCFSLSIHLTPNFPTAINCLSTPLKKKIIGVIGGAWGADAPSSECLVPFFRVFSALFYTLFHFKIVTPLKVF